MNRSELVSAAAERAGTSASAMDAALHAIQDVVTDALTKGEKVTIPGFATLETVQRSAREGRNPATGEKMQILSLIHIWTLPTTPYV